MAKLWQFSQGHPKPAFSEKVQGEDEGKFFKNRLKSSFRLNGPEALCRKGHYPRFWRIRRIQKCPNGHVMAIFASSPKLAFSEIVQRGDQGKFFKNRPKSSPRLKGLKALWRK